MRSLIFVCTVFLLTVTIVGQEQKPAATPPISPSARLSEVTAPEDNNGVSVSSSTDSGGHSVAKSSRDISVAIIKLMVYDARTHLMLWTANEKPKGAFKDKARQDNLVEAAQKLLAKFRDRMEPLPAK
jgi:hypothetical protein